MDAWHLLAEDVMGLMAANLLRMWRLVRDEHPRVLRPCMDDTSELFAYTPRRAARMVRTLVEDAMVPISGAFSYEEFCDELMMRYGCTMEEAESAIRRPQEMAVFQPLQACRIQCYRARCDLPAIRRSHCNRIDVFHR